LFQSIVDVGVAALWAMRSFEFVAYPFQHVPMV
jgi:hypothetical protein